VAVAVAVAVAAVVELLDQCVEVTEVSVPE
jgi:hypothetical protein